MSRQPSCVERWTGMVLSVFAMSVCGLWSVPAEAQTPQRSSPPKNGVQLGVGVRWNNRATFLSEDANELTPTGGTARLFSVTGGLDSAFGVQVYVSPRLTKTLRLDVTGAYAIPNLGVTVGDDVEDARSVVASEPIKQILVEFAIVAEHDGMNPARRTVPFTFAGVGIGRDMHDGQTLIETSQGYFVGIGAKHFMMRGRTRRDIGLRWDVRMIVRMNGALLDNKAHLGGTLGASLFWQL